MAAWRLSKVQHLSHHLATLPPPPPFFIPLVNPLSAACNSVWKLESRAGAAHEKEEKREGQCCHMLSLRNDGRARCAFLQYTYCSTWVAFPPPGLGRLPMFDGTSAAQMGCQNAGLPAGTSLHCALFLKVIFWGGLCGKEVACIFSSSKTWHIAFQKSWQLWRGGAQQ